MIALLKNTKIPLFNRIFGESDNRIAYAADVNEVINNFNAGFGYLNYEIKVTQSGTSAPEKKYMTSGSTDNCKSNCSSICSACDCTVSCLNELSSSPFRFTRNDVGIYTLSLTLNSPQHAKGIADVSLWTTPAANPAHTIAITPNGVNVDTKIWSFTIKTTSGPGVLADDILNNIFMSAHVYVK